MLNMLLFVQSAGTDSAVNLWSAHVFGDNVASERWFPCRRWL